MITKVELPKNGFKAISQYGIQPVYFFRFNAEETENGTVACDETTVKIKGATYEKMVSVLIGVKFSTDAQIALLYNYQNNPVEYADAMLEYQQWRVYCKEAARIFFGIELTLDDIKERKIVEIEAYDNSDAVNSFDIVVNGQTMVAWLTPEKRSDYKNSLDSAELLGMPEVHPVFNGVTLTIPTQTAKMALAKIQIYANQCYGVTAQHKAAVNALTSVTEVEVYEYKTGYPERLVFDIAELR